MPWMNGNAGHGTHLHTLGFVEMTDTLGAFRRVDLVDLRPKVNGLVGAFRLAHVAVDALVGDHQGHGDLS
jgi:hypothetical protein